MLLCLCPYLKISLTDLEASENFTKNTIWPVSKNKLENVDKKGSLGLCLSSLHSSVEHLIEPYAKLDPADGTSTWDSLHSHSSESLGTSGKLFPSLGIWRSGQSGCNSMASCHPLYPY